MKYNFITVRISSVYDAETAGVSDRGRRGDVVHSGRRAPLRVPARALAPDQGARGERRRRVARAPAAGRAADPDGTRVPPPRDGGPARGRGGPPRGAGGRRPRGGARGARA